MEGQTDFDYSTLCISMKSGPRMAKPLPCWCRGREAVPLEQNPLIQWFRRQRLGRRGELDRESPLDGFRALGRGRPLATNGQLCSSDFSDDDTNYVEAFWQGETRLIAPSLDTSQPAQPVDRAVPTVPLPEQQPTRDGDLGIPPPSKLEEPDSHPRARRDIIPQTWKPRREELPSGTAAPPQASRSPPTPVPRDQPQTSRPRPSHAGDTTEGATASSVGSCRNHREELTRRRARAPVQEVRVPPRRLDPSEFHSSDLNLWRNSWTLIRHRDNASDNEHSETDEEEEDEEEDEEAILEQGSLTEDSSLLPSESCRDVNHWSIDSPSSAAAWAPPPAVEESTNPQGRFLEIKGLLKIITVETIYDVVASYVSVRNVEVFHADGAVGALLTLTQPYPIPWMTKCIEKALLCEGEPGPLVVTSTPSEGDTL